VLVAVTLLWLPGSRGSAAFAQVLENVKKASTVAFICKQKIGDTPAYEQKYYGQGDSVHVDGEGGNSVQISNMKTGESLSINHAQKTAVKFKYERGPDAPMTSPMESITSITEKDATLVGEVELDGKKARLYHLTSIGPTKLGAADKAKIWVDVTNGLPIRIELQLVGPEGKKASCVFENFEWNVPLKPELFALEAPEGYTVTHGAPVKLMPVKPAVLAFTQVVENMKKATSVTFVSMRSDRPPSDRETKWYLIDGLERIETADKKKVSITSAKEKAMLRLDSDKKTAQLRQLTDPQAAVSPMDDLLNLTEDDAELVEATELDGRKVRLYRLKRVVFPRFGLGTGKAASGDKKVNARIWVDDETNLPVRIALESISARNQTDQSVVLEKFNWNEKLDSKLFNLDVPSGFKLLEAKPKTAP
jgi:outer membrane lipoprotein-sorting protein